MDGGFEILEEHREWEVQYRREKEKRGWIEMERDRERGTYR